MRNRRTLRLGTRGSNLALRQSELVAAVLRRAGHEVESIVVVTDGDVRPPDTAWGEGAFVGALERALLEERVDLAVHSAKDVPLASGAGGGLWIAAYPAREDPRDALLVRDGLAPESPAQRQVRAAGDAELAGPGRDALEVLPTGARVGTDSPRRAAFLLAARPDLRIVPLHGNVDSRLRRLDADEVDAMVVAVAGLVRLGHAGRPMLVLDPTTLPPAPAQGALAVECRTDDAALRDALATLDHPVTRRCVEAERQVLRSTGGGCRAPLGALATPVGDRVDLLAGVVVPGMGPLMVRGSAPGDRGLDLARALAAALRGAGFRGDLA